MFTNTCREGAEEMEPGSFSDARCQDQRQGTQTETQQCPTENQETLLHCKGDQILAEVAQRL